MVFNPIIKTLIGEDSSVAAYFDITVVLSVDGNKIGNVTLLDKCDETLILMTKDLLGIDEIPPNIKYIIIPDSFNEEDLSKNKIITIPIILLIVVILYIANLVKLKKIQKNCIAE